MSRLIRLLIKISIRIGYRFTVDGIENIPPAGPVLVAINSVSFMDTLFVQAALKRPALFLVDAHDLKHARLLRPFLLLCGAIGVDFGNEAEKKAAYEKAAGSECFPKGK